MTKKRLRATPLRQELPLDANALDLFARIVAAGGFAAAARQLGLTRAAVSRRVATIEAALGQPLFARTTRALGLTEAGRRLASRARSVAEATDAARAHFRAQAAEGIGGTLRVTSVPIFAPVLAPLLARFQALHPQLRLELQFTLRRVDLLREDVDVAFRITRRPPEDWVAREVLPFTVRAWAAPRAGLPLAHPQDLARERCLLLAPPSESFALTFRDASGQQSRVELTPAATADDMATLFTLALAGDGIVFATDFSVAAQVSAGALVNALPGWQVHLAEGDAVLALTLPAPAASEAARRLVAFVAEALKPV